MNFLSHKTWDCKKCTFCFSNKICWLPIKARQSRPILDHPGQSNIMCFSFSWDSFVTNNLWIPKNIWDSQDQVSPLSQLASLSYTCQLSKCNAGDTMRCIFVSIFRSASSKICKDNFNRAFVFETDHIPKKHENAHRAPSLCLPSFLTLCATFVNSSPSPKFIWISDFRCWNIYFPLPLRLH